MKSKLTKAQYHEHMSVTLKLYREFDEAIERLRELGRDFTPGSDERFAAQLALCQDMRLQLVRAENLEEIDG